MRKLIRVLIIVSLLFLSFYWYQGEYVKVEKPAYNTNSWQGGERILLPSQQWVPKKVNRVIALDVNHIEIMLALGLGDKIVLASLQDEAYKELASRYANEIKKIGEVMNQQIPLEKILMLQTDLILARKSSFSLSYLYSPKWWEERGIGVYITPTSFVRKNITTDDELNYIRDMGIIFDKEEAVEKLIYSLQDRISKIREKSLHHSKEKIIVLEGVINKYIVSYDDRWLVSNLIKSLGGNWRLKIE